MIRKYNIYVLKEKVILEEYPHRNVLFYNTSCDKERSTIIR